MARTIGGPFGRSAFGPVHELALKVLACARRANELTAAVAEGSSIEGGRARVRELALDVSRLEGEADAIKGEIRRSLSRSLFSSVERGDLLLLVKSVDNIADDCERAAKLLAVRPWSLPAPVTGGLARLAGEATRAGELLAGATGALRRDDAEPDAESAGGRLEAISRQDDAVRESSARFLDVLFAHEASLSPVDVVLLMQVGEWIRRVGSQSENAADVLSRLAGR